MWLIVSIILSGAVGYLVGAANTFRRQKLGVYEESLPIIIKTAFRHPDPFNGEIGPTDKDKVEDETKFNKAVIGCLLFASKKVAQKVDRVCSILIDRSRGNLMEALQDLIAGMRADIQISPGQKIKPEDIDHISTKIADR